MILFYDSNESRPAAAPKRSGKRAQLSPPCPRAWLPQPLPTTHGSPGALCARAGPAAGNCAKGGSACERRVFGGGAVRWGSLWLKAL